MQNNLIDPKIYFFKFIETMTKRCLNISTQNLIRTKSIKIKTIKIKLNSELHDCFCYDCRLHIW